MVVDCRDQGGNLSVPIAKAISNAKIKSPLILGCNENVAKTKKYHLGWFRDTVVQWS